MFLFARESRYVTATNKIMFWISIFGSVVTGVVFFGFFSSGALTNVFVPHVVLLAVVMLTCAICMCMMLFGNRIGGYAAIGFAALMIVGSLLLSIACNEYEVALAPAGIGLLCLWPTLATLFGEKRLYQKQVNEKLEFSLRGSVLGKIFFGSLYLMTVLMIVFGVINLYH